MYYLGLLSSLITARPESVPTPITACIVAGKKEGESKVTSVYGRLAETQYFHDDQLAKTVVNRKVTKGIIQPTAPLNFEAYLNKQLKPYSKTGAGKKVVIKLLVNKNGTVKDPVLTEGYNDMFTNQAVIDLIKNSGKWKAGSIDKHATEMTTFCTISYSKAGLSYSLSKY